MVKKLAISAASLALCVSVLAQSPQVRMAGLEHNDEYMAMLREDALLENRIDSLASVIDGLRRQLADGDARGEQTSDIVALESEYYSLRDSRSRLGRRINAVEQEWLMANMTSATDADAEPDKPAEAVPSGRQYADLVRNEYFARSLSHNDYAALLRAQEYEKDAVRLLAEYSAAHDDFARLKAQYDTVGVESAADSLFSLLLSAQSRCTTLSDSLSDVWSYTFDNKSYLYDLLLDKAGREDMLSREEKRVYAARQEIEKVQGAYASEAAVKYCFQKRCIVDYESDVAVAAGLHLAADSLSRVRASLGRLKYDFPKIIFSRRYFLEYQPLAFSSQYVYTVNNPVPECTVYEHGEIYRIKLGEFTAKQPAAKFKGLEPVSYLHTENGKWIYYAGGYRSIEELEKALATVKKLGFRTADVAAWLDGAYADSREEAEELMSKVYSVEISGCDNLPQNVRELILANVDESSIARAGRGLFVIGGLRSKDAAETLANGIAAADSSLSVVVAE